MNFTLFGMFSDVAVVSAFLLCAKIVRSKVAWLQNHYIPSSLIAGFAALLLSEQFAGLFAWTEEAASYPYLLICILFAGIFLGRKGVGNAKEVFSKVGDTFFVNTGSEVLCFGVPLLLGGVIMAVAFPAVFPELALLLPAGFPGGHGYAAAIGGALNSLLGRGDAVYIGQTFATIGLLVGLIGGVAVVNLGIRMRATRLVWAASELPEEMRTGLLPEGRRPSMGSETVSPMSIDPLAWHLCLILVSAGIGYLAQQGLAIVLPGIDFPLMCLTMLGGLLLQKILDGLGYSDYVDKKVIDRIGGCLTDYLVAFGVATIRVSVIAEFWQPITVLCIMGTVLPLLIVFFIGRRLFRNFWFERSVFMFGYLTGIVAVGITLLRNVDPEMRSGTLADYGLSYTVQSLVEIALVASSPFLVVSAGVVPAGALLTAIGLVMLAVCWRAYGLQPASPSSMRAGEGEVLKDAGIR